MAVSKQTYECYRCRDNGFPNVRVYLDGKTESGKTIYKNEDMTLHQHKQQQQPKNFRFENSQQQEQPIDFKSLQSTLKADFESISAKLDKITKLLEKGL